MWDDLFRAAAGDDTGPVESNAQTTEPESQTQTNPRKREIAAGSGSRRRRKNKKQSSTNTHHNSSQELLERILKSRTDPIDRQIWSKIPTWLSPGSSLCDPKICRRWEQDSNCLLSSNCKICKRSLLYHSLFVSPSIARKQHGSGMVLTSFALVRDIRCCCSCFLMDVFGLSSGQTSSSNSEGYIITATAKSNELANMDFSSILIPGEADILMGKFQKVQSAAIALRERLERQPKGKLKTNRIFKQGGLFDKVIRLMICCDAAYFRMYYLQNSGNLPIANETAFLPHPPTYFGSKNVAWDVVDHTVDLLKTLRKKNIEISDERWDALMTELGVTPSCSDLDSMSFMQKNRLSESIFLYRKSSWVHSTEAKDQFMESTKQKSKSRDLETLFYTTHETPAPAILREWRDSCRDFLCNLYAYATIPPGMVDDIKSLLGEKNIACKSILEIGAGTGYIANLLCKAGLSVRAFDVAPTQRGDNPHGDINASNEYHGSSPPFCRVEYADAENLQSIFGKNKAKQSALLLCYAQPLSSMGEDSLKSFVNHGGKILIHIGEFSGLTGSSKFEQFLSRHFDLKYRARCLNWGSDAAELTIWAKSEVPANQRQRILVRCSRCQNSSATSRFRMCRPLAYCGEACFDAHKIERGLHFAVNMIPDSMNANDVISYKGVDKEKYFEPLPCKCNL